ncbi:putative aldouronate transport system substrate-binding protein [Paenibacillus phyllosphaerae]|uniref:Putative aldouronate transport system substrate-binding protein n=1 Tax=Paenibacillus phyllosphaerae TaxID=274593 RepID=A0A7W5ASW0_9BACL|nr:extracellular solute-binding protein [Paenibacillus phyllosphaerae]MBB3108002.1 putative aldouronate transport system substrate-binding protein [Paenibacillus phyllosphaerae]
MKKAKTGLALLLVAAVAGLTACSSSENGNNQESSASSNTGANAEAVIDPMAKFPEPVEVGIGRAIDPNYKFEGSDTAEDNAYTRWLKDTYNIVVKHTWEASIADYNQKVSISIGSNDLPDAMLVNESQVRQMVKAGQLADLTEVYGKYGNERLKQIYESNPGLLDNVTFDGKLYALPETTLPSAPLTWIRQDWLDKLRLQPPKTLEDLENIAKAFVDNKLGGDNTIGIIGTGQGGSLYSNFLASSDHFMNFSPLFFANDAYPGIWVNGEDGNAAYGSILPETKNALALMKGWYDKGILDKEIGLRKSSQEVISSGQAGIFFGPWWSPYNLTDSIKNDPNANWKPFVAPLDAEGKFNSNQATGSTFIVVKKQFKHPEAVIKMLNIHVSEKDPSYATAVGKELTSQEIPLFLIMGHGDQLDYAVNTTQKVLKGEMTLEQVDKLNYGFTYELSSHVKDVKLEPYDNYDIQYWNKDDDFFSHLYAHLNGGSAFINADINWVRSLATAQTQTMQTKWTNLKKLEDETFLKIIMGGASIDEFDTFVTKWKEQGGDQITKEVNELK